MSKNNKTFIIQYDPTATPREMFQGFWEAVEKGEKSIQPKNLMVVDSIETIYKLMTEPRLEIFYAISEKKPASLNQLAESLGKNSANVWRDCQMLANLGIIKLEKVGNEANVNKRSKEVRPVALYQRIVFDFPNQEVFKQKNGRIVLAVNH